MNKRRTWMALLITLCIILNSLTPFAVFAMQPETAMGKAIVDTCEYLLEAVESPQVNTIGGEWAVIGLGRSSVQVPQSWYHVYYKNLMAYVQEKNGILHEKKYSEYSRVILALTAIGKDPKIGRAHV